VVPVLALSSGPVGWVVAFAAGMLSFLSPCVLPLVPGYLSLMTGLSATELAGSVKTRTDTAKVLRSTLLFVAGFTIVFVAYGVGATAIGQLLQDNQVLFNRVSGVLIILLGLFLAGLISPLVLQRERRFHVSPSKLGVFAPPVMGMAFAFGWSPCIGAVLGPILTAASQGNTATQGAILLFFYSLGLGVPFVGSGLAFGKLTGTFAWVKRHFGIINFVAGMLLVAFGVLLLTNRVYEISQRMVDLMDRLGLDFLTQI
jgi:cytochrome c-type biogenesis protein